MQAPSRMLNPSRPAILTMMGDGASASPGSGSASRIVHRVICNIPYRLRTR